MLKYYPFLFLISLITSCIPDANISNVYSSIIVDKSELFADGKSTATITVELNSKTSQDRRNVIFTTNVGSFSNDFKKKTTIKASFVDGKLIAKATIIAPTILKKIIIKIEPEFDSNLKEYFSTVEIDVKESEPAKIVLTPSNLGIEANFNSEVIVIGTLFNIESKSVSDGNRVIFEDILENGESANGLFRALSDTTVDSSRVSCIYGASNHPIGTKIKIRGTILDRESKFTSISDSILL